MIITGLKKKKKKKKKGRGGNGKKDINYVYIYKIAVDSDSDSLFIAAEERRVCLRPACNEEIRQKTFKQISSSLRKDVISEL